jgi:hypothetical protein
MSGDVDPLYRASRQVILDVLNALGAHRDSLTLVGAHALYQFTGRSELGIVEYTTDADFSITPSLVAQTPRIEVALEANGFTRPGDVGRWKSPSGIFVDLMVPEAVAGERRRKNSRSAVLDGHGPRVSRRTKGIEGALIDRAWMVLGGIEEGSDLVVETWVAGPAALLVAKSHKIAERLGDGNRLRDKDALDVFRLFQAVSTHDFVERFELLINSDVAQAVTLEALRYVGHLFGDPDAPGVLMAKRLGDEVSAGEFIATSLVLLANDLLDHLEAVHLFTRDRGISG